MTEQRNPYRGSPPRAWLRVHVIGVDGRASEKELLVDTGSPFTLILSTGEMQSLRQMTGTTVHTNFGVLTSGWLHVVIPEIGFDHHVFGYASDEVVAAAQSSSPAFQGLAGLPLLRMMQYGGDATSFWLRPQ
jgi:hypothetical protein